MDKGFSGRTKIIDCKQMVEPNMERMVFDFLIEHLESHSNNLREKDYYLNIVSSPK